ncbi:MAG: RNB domain-containing ribonuclease [Planctomycetes bacterium]|nr:RNB domain-containing ribonuclease [Planctomycetota bacterium]
MAAFLAHVVNDGRLARGLFDPEQSQPLDPALPTGSILRVEDGTPCVLAAPDTARASLYRLLARHGVDPIHSPEVRAEVAKIVADPGIDDPALIDRRDLAFVTIDNDDSLDLDQALYVERTEQGFTVYYALADAAHFVRPKTALMEASLQRGTSYYLPGLCVPMLPAELSEDLVSLNADVDRRALVFVLELDAEARSLRTTIERARIRSRAKLSYPGVQAYHDAPGESPIAGQEYAESLDLLRVVGELRIELARARGVVEYDRSELSVALEEGGERFLVGVRRRNEVERWNEQISLLCNMEGADVLQAGAALEHVQPVFRVHPPPLLRRLGELEGVIDAIVAQRRLDAAWRWARGDEELAVYLRRIEAKGSHTRVVATIRRQIRYANRASTFQAKSGLHHALGVDGYARFSAPMREVVGIFTHKEGLERLGLATPSDSADDLELRTRAITAANEAKKRQRALTKEAHGLAIDQLLADDLSLSAEDRPIRAGSVFGLRGSRLYVALDDFPIELKVYRADLEASFGCSYAPSRDNTVLAPREGEGPTFALGDEILIQTDARDAERRRWSFRIRSA